MTLEDLDLLADIPVEARRIADDLHIPYRYKTPVGVIRISKSGSGEGPR